jgi:hypothetical protein
MAGGHQRSHSEDQLLTTVESQVQNPDPGKEMHMHATHVLGGFVGYSEVTAQNLAGVKVLTRPA